jgi:pimeloyl-ACP methyl ester carboxylesterase
LLALLSACAPRDAYDAAAFMIALRDGGPPLARQAIAWTEAGQQKQADLYLPPEGAPGAAVVLVPGLAPAGRDDPRLGALARSLAARRFAVLVPELPNLRAQKVAASDGADIASAVRHLLTRPQGRAPVGIMAISYAAGPAFMAALEPDIRDKVAFVVAVGGYYDLPAVVTFFTTGHFRAPGETDWHQAEPNAYGKWVFVQANAERIERPFDRVALSAMARRKLADLAAPIDDLEQGLGPEGAAVVALLRNSDPDRVPALIATLPAAIRDDMAALDLARRDLGQLRARVVLVHGRDDAIIPYTQSLALAAALPPGQARLEVLGSLAHADLGPGGLFDLVRLWRAAYALMRERE